MNVSEALENLKNFDINDLDFKTAGSWPGPVKAICCLLVAVVVLVLTYYLVIEDMQVELENVASQEQTLKDQYKVKAERVANLDEYKEQMVEMEQTFGALLQQLPSDTEVPGLLEDISAVGEQAGLEIESIVLRPEAVREFYTELPIQIGVQGSYHDLAAFVSGVAGLPRIVTLHDFSISKSKAPGASPGAGVERLRMDITAKTYRYSGDRKR